MKLVLTLILLLGLAVSQAPVTANNTCTQVGPSPPRGGRSPWSAQYDRNVDFRILGGRVIAYKLQWFAGSWSDWFVPDYNDIDGKVTVVGTTSYLRRWWSYFEDHNHTYIICK